MNNPHPDIFKNVHKGIRHALFEACIALGQADDDDATQTASARSLLLTALHFVNHHGENEDTLLLPLLHELAPSVYDRLQKAHAKLATTLNALTIDIETVPVSELYHRTSHFIALYLDHMLLEELELDPVIRTSVPPALLTDFARRSVERTSPADKQQMLGWMLPAMSPKDVEAFLARLPAEAREPLRLLAHSHPLLR